MQYNQCFILHIPIVIKHILTGTKSLPYVIRLRSVIIHLSVQGIIIIAIVDDIQRIKRIVAPKMKTPPTKLLIKAIIYTCG